MSFFVSMMGNYMLYFTLLEDMLLYRYSTDGYTVHGRIIGPIKKNNHNHTAPNNIKISPDGGITSSTITTETTGVDDIHNHYQHDNKDKNNDNEDYIALVEYKYVEQCLGGYTMTVRKEIIAQQSDFYTEQEQHNNKLDQHHPIQIIFDNDNDDNIITINNKNNKDNNIKNNDNNDVVSDSDNNNRVDSLKDIISSISSKQQLMLDVIIISDYPYSGLSRSTMKSSLLSCFRGNKTSSSSFSIICFVRF